eukprot:462685_1
MVLIPSLTTMRPTSVTTTTNNNNNISIPPQPNQSPLSIANESQSSPLSITNESQSSSSETKNNTENNKDIQPKIKDKDKDKDNDIEIDNISAIIPEQPNKHYLSIIVSPEWNDSKLIPDLVRHISQHTGKHIGDAYISNRIRLGFFTAKNQSVATQFVRNTREQKVKCWGRTVSADIIPLPKNNNNIIGHGGHPIGIQRQQNGYRVKIQNVNCIMGRRDFEQWVYKSTNTSRRRHLIYDIEIVFPKIQRGSNQCIMLFDKADDTKYVMDKIQNVQFRGLPLVFKHWNHPNYISPTINQLQNVKNMNKNKKKLNRNMNNKDRQTIQLNKNKIKSKPQNNIWAKMAKQRNQKKLQQQKQKMKQQKKQEDKVENKPIINDNASSKSSKSNKSNSPNKNIIPLQPTKPPKKLINTPNINVNDVSNTSNDKVTTPDNTITEVNNDNINNNNNNNNDNINKKPQPRVPPLINLFR